MTKLMRTTEAFECETREEAEALVAKFEGEAFPRLLSSSIAERGGVYEVEAVKEFGAPLDGMSFGA